MPRASWPTVNSHWMSFSGRQLQQHFLICQMLQWLYNRLKVIGLGTTNAIVLWLLTRYTKSDHISVLQLIKMLFKFSNTIGHGISSYLFGIVFFFLIMVNKKSVCYYSFKTCLFQTALNSLPAFHNYSLGQNKMEQQSPIPLEIKDEGMQRPSQAIFHWCHAETFLISLLFSDTERQGS